MRVVSRIDFSMVKVLFGRIDLMDETKLCRIESHSINQLQWKEDSGTKEPQSKEFEQTHELILNQEHIEISTDGTVVSKLEKRESEITDEKRQHARERYFARKKQKMHHK
jgi:hypothetical protein